MRGRILNLLRKVLPKGTAIAIEVPENDNFGHYSTNAAFALGKKSGRSPMEVAREIAEEMRSVAPAGLFARVDTAPPGFVNFWLEPAVFQKEIQEILKRKKNYGRAEKRKEKVQVEFVSANPTGPLTLANGRGGFLGDVLSNVLEWNGFKVEREYYVNDTGNQIIVLGKSAVSALGLIPDEEKFYKGDYVKDWARRNAPFVKKNKDNYLKIGQKAAAQFLNETKIVLGRYAGVGFDRWTSEDKNIHKKGLVKKVLAIFEKKKLTYKKDGAVWLKTTDFGDDKDRVLITSDGFPTYFLADAGHYLETKIRGFSRKINILGPDHYGYKARIQAVAEIVGLKNSEIIITQVIRLMKEGQEFKMSKRKGSFITFEDLVSEVGVDAARFFLLMIAPETHIDFDMSLAKERSQKNPVFYVQYAFVRAKAIITKANSKFQIPNYKLRILNTKEDFNLIHKLVQFQEIIEDTAYDYQVHRLTRYATELAREFHNFYEKERVVGEAKETAAARLALVRATATVFENLFGILGISAPEKM